MSGYEVAFYPDALKDIKRLDGSQRKMKIKLRGSGIRIVYRLIRIKEKMAIVVVGAREDMEVYRTAQRRTLDFEKWAEENI